MLIALSGADRFGSARLGLRAKRATFYNLVTQRGIERCTSMSIFNIRAFSAHTKQFDIITLPHPFSLLAPHPSLAPVKPFVYATSLGM